MQLDPTLFRAYDIRGLVDSTLTLEAARLIGRAFAQYVATHAKTRTHTVCVGYDGRLSSPGLRDAFIEALIQSGMDVLDIGVCPTPMLYYATHTLQAAGGVMITGSHNGPRYNGFKMMLEHSTLYGDAIQELYKIASAGKFRQGRGTHSNFSVEESYLNAVMRGFNVTSTHYMPSIAWDPGNGSAGDVLRALLMRLPGKQVLINSAIDGTFPNHHPDPSKASNLQQLKDVVRKEHCDFGIAFDGDADRIGVIDQYGTILWGDQLLYLFAKDALALHPGATIIADVKASQGLFSRVAQLGGNALMWKTGHSLIKAKMAETGALLAGEMSGHIFFKEHHGIDDALYAAVKLFDLVARKGQPLAQLLLEYPQHFATPEIRIEVEESQKATIIEALGREIKNSNATIHTIDGLRVHTDKGWWLLRASNTEPVLVARVEAYHHDDLEPMIGALSALLAPHGIAFRV